MTKLMKTSVVPLKQESNEAFSNVFTVTLHALEKERHFNLTQASIKRLDDALARSLLCATQGFQGVPKYF